MVILFRSYCQKSKRWFVDCVFCLEYWIFEFLNNCWLFGALSSLDRIIRILSSVKLISQLNRRLWIICIRWQSRSQVNINKLPNFTPLLRLRQILDCLQINRLPHSDQLPPSICHLFLTPSTRSILGLRFLRIQEPWLTLKSFPLGPR